MHDLPHPGLLPKEKENRSQSPGNTCDWICRTVIRNTRDSQQLFPLPGGEGQGEGERSNKRFRSVRRPRHNVAPSARPIAPPGLRPARPRFVPRGTTGN